VARQPARAIVERSAAKTRGFMILLQLSTAKRIAPVP
jgi:hypothetical protein